MDKPLLYNKQMEPNEDTNGGIHSGVEGLASYDFFIPLPEALAIPDGYIVNIEDVDDLIDDEPALRYINSDGLNRKLSARIGFQQFETGKDTHLINLSSQGFSRFYGLENKETEKSLHTGSATVAHVGVIGRRGADERQVSAYFDQGLLQLRRFLKTYYSVNRTPIVMPSRQNTGGFIMQAVENITSDGMPEGDDRSSLQIGVFLTGGPIDRSTIDSSVEPIDVSFLTDPNIIDASDLLQPYMDAYREATTARVNGDYISASILYAAAIEIFFDQVLQLLLWEEGLTPGEAFEKLFATKSCGCDDCKETISTTFDRAKSGMYQQRIGGDWDVYKSEMMKKWQTLRYTRNDAVHGGKEPSDADIEVASRIVDELVSWVIDLLADNVALYPVTLFTLAGRSGIEKRGAWDAFEKVDKWMVPISIPTIFGNWKHEVMRLHPFSQNKKTTDASCHLACVLHQNGQRYWVFCDFKNKLFRYTAEPPLPSEADQLLSEVEEKRMSNGNVKTLVVRLDDIRPVSDNRKKVWHPVYLISSDYGISRYPLSYVMPNL